MLKHRERHYGGYFLIYTFSQRIFLASICGEEGVRKEFTFQLDLTTTIGTEEKLVISLGKKHAKLPS